MIIREAVCVLQKVCNTADTLVKLYFFRQKKNLYLRAWNCTPLCWGCDGLRSVWKSGSRRRERERELRIPLLSNRPPDKFLSGSAFLTTWVRAKPRVFISFHCSGCWRGPVKSGDRSFGILLYQYHVNNRHHTILQPMSSANAVHITHERRKSL